MKILNNINFKILVNYNNNKIIKHIKKMIFWIKNKIFLNGYNLQQIYYMLLEIKLTTHYNYFNY
jgi:hypothetical protein